MKQRQGRSLFAAATLTVAALSVAGSVSASAQQSQCRSPSAWSMPTGSCRTPRPSRVKGVATAHGLTFVITRSITPYFDPSYDISQEVRRKLDAKLPSLKLQQSSASNAQ
jgi:hypothetical protein